MDPNNYATAMPLTPDELLEKGSSFQVEIDGLEADLDDNKDAAKAIKEKLKRFAAKVAKIFHAREAGKDLYELNAGELTDEAPDEDTLPLGDGESYEESRVEEPEDDELPLDTQGQDDGSMDALHSAEASPYPGMQPGQIYTAKAPAGNTCTVKESAGKVNIWTGRVSGKPVAVDVELLKAFQVVEAHVDADSDGLGWTPTLEIDFVDEDSVDAELEGVDL